MSSLNSSRASETLWTRMAQSIKSFELLLASVPAVTLSLFVLAVFSMNLLANKSVALPVDWLALDCGFIVSWFVFLVLDVLTKHFGPKAATQLSVFAMGINLAVCAIFYAVSLVPGTWGAADVAGSETIINEALNSTFGGTWYVIAGSSIAFAVAAITNNFCNHFVGFAFKANPNGLVAYLCRSLTSTALAQFLDNFVFALLVSRVFFDWTLLQCATCALFGMLFELACQVLFSMIGYRMSQAWQRRDVGAEYLRHVAIERN